jgi:hypothetical protein
MATTKDHPEADTDISSRLHSSINTNKYVFDEMSTRSLKGSY